MIRDIFKGSKDIPADMYERTFKKLSEGVTTGYGDKLKDGIDADMVYQLKNNVKVFSAFKANSYKDTMISLLVDKDNKQRSWSDFLKEAKKVDNDYNKTWLAAEFNMATRQARSAKQWKTFERDADVYPNLQFMPSRSANPRDAHQKYYGIIKPISDPFWSVIPPLDWGCLCWLKQTREPVTDSVNDSEEQNGHEGLAGNAGKDKKVFTADHSYINHLGKGEKDLVKKFLQKHSDLGTEEIHLTIGKNKITVPLDADPTDLINSINVLQPTVKKYKRDFSINSHSFKDGIKNPELLDDKKTVGDAVKMDSKQVDSTIKGAFKKLQPEKQLSNYKKVFLAINFQGKLNDKNVTAAARKLYGEMNANSKVKYVILVNEQKSLIINQGENFDLILQKAKKELL